MSSTESSHPPDPIANNKEEGLGPCVLAAEAEVATSKATSKDNVQQLGTEVARVTKIYIGAPEDDKSSGQYGLDKNSGDGLRSAKKSRRDVVDTEAVIMRKLFVRNLNSNVTEDKMRTYFSDFGEIENVQLPTYSDSGKIQGFAFVTFKESSSVDAVQTARPHRLDGWQLETTRATPKENIGNPKYEARWRVFIGGVEDERRGGHFGLTDDISDLDLQEYFSKFGNVTKIDQKIWEVRLG